MKRILYMNFVGLTLSFGLLTLSPPVQALPVTQVASVNCGIDISQPTAIGCLMTKYINPVINLLAAIVGVVVVGSIIAAAIQYSASEGDPNKVSLAKRRIANDLLALAGFIFLYSLLQWLVPGGYFK